VEEVDAMRGPWRFRKKHLRQAGWQIIETDKGQRLIMQKPANGGCCEATIEAPTRPRAYYQAEHCLLNHSQWLAS